MLDWIQLGADLHRAYEYSMHVRDLGSRLGAQPLDLAMREQSVRWALLIGTGQPADGAGHGRAG